MLARGAFMTMTKNVLNMSSRVVASPNLTNLVKQNNNDALVHRYSTNSSGQQLLRFPAFPLEETLQTFLKTCEPLLTPEEYQETEKETHNFNRDEGVKLQALLSKAAEKEENWLAERWLHAAYLQYRDPVTVYSSPGMTFPMATEMKTDRDFAEYAAKLVFGLLKYKQLIDGGEIPIVKMGKFELDNSQFKRCFGTCRIPGHPADDIEYHPDSKHIVVIYKNHFYKLPVYNESCIPIKPDILAIHLEKIIQCEQKPGIPFGLLTLNNRNSWSTAYPILIKNPINAESVKTIQTSLFTLSLDENVEYYCKDVYNILSEQLIHGGDPDENSANRWMDKTMQLVVNPNGMNGFCYEHSPAEGQPIALMVDYIFNNFKNKKFWSDGADDASQEPVKLRLETDECLDLHIGTATVNARRLINNLQMHVLKYERFGKEFLKTQKLSPDSFIQMALQYAFYKMHKVPAAHYESAHLRIYYNGRTETIRSCSNESVAFAKAMLNSSASDVQRVELLRKAVNGHRTYTNMALQGRGVDRHLLGLKLMAIENGEKIPKLYQTPGFIKSSHFRLSTSQVASNYEAFMCYGPSANDGYGCCYNPRKCDMFFAISAWRSDLDTDAKYFAKTLSESLDSMYNLLISAGEQPSSKL